MHRSSPGRDISENLTRGGVIDHACALSSKADLLDFFGFQRSQALAGFWIRLRHHDGDLALVEVATDKGY
jgi:hypothetical protein